MFVFLMLEERSIFCSLCLFGLICPKEPNSSFNHDS